MYYSTYFGSKPQDFPHTTNTVKVFGKLSSTFQDKHILPIEYSKTNQQKSPFAFRTAYYISLELEVRFIFIKGIMLTEDVPPNQTIYINNINEKIKKDALKKELYNLFSQFGKIMDVVASKAHHLRGQAWIVFEDVGAASNAMRQMQSYPFYEKPMRIQFAKTKSDAVAKVDGTYVPREKRKREDKQAPRKQQASNQSKQSKAQQPGGAPVPTDGEVPHHILFCEELPTECNQAMLTMLFQQYPGFKEVRMVPGKNMSFVEFGDEGQAAVALQYLRGFKLSPTDSLKVKYAKK